MAFHDPILHGAEFCEVVAAFVAGLRYEGVLINLAQAGGDWCQIGLTEFGGNLLRGLRELFAHQLTGFEDVHAVVENDRNHRQPQPRHGADFLHALHVGQAQLHGRGDVLLHFLRRQRGRLRKDDDLVGGDVRHGVDGELRQRITTPADQAQHQHPDDELVADAESDDGIE